jgi:hypothetical protein
MSNHLHPEELLDLLDGTRSAPDAHLLGCPYCRERADAMWSGLKHYADYREHLLVPSVPPPPAAWSDLDRGMDEVDAKRSYRRRDVPRVEPIRRPRFLWAAAAAALLLAAYSGYRRIPSVQAAALLERAIAVAPSARPSASIRVRTKRRDFVRPTVIHATPAQSGELPSLFAAARFDWEQPFTARAFANWRSLLSDRRDRVECDPGLCLITTTSASNPLFRATLALRESDLAPMSESLEFRGNETVEISASTGAADIAPLAPPAPTPAPHRAAPSVPAPPAALLLHVLDALHPIRADLGELELSESGSHMLVHGAGLSSGRREQIGQALSGIDGVDLDLTGDSSATPMPRSATVRGESPKGPAPLRAVLESKLTEGAAIEDTVDRILDSSDAVMAQAFALRYLARRYSPSEERALSPSDRDRLTLLREDYRRELRIRFRQLSSQLTPLLPGESVPATIAATWQLDAEQTCASVQSLDSLLAVALAGPARSGSSPADLLQQLGLALSRAEAAVEARP